MSSMSTYNAGLKGLEFYPIDTLKNFRKRKVSWRPLGKFVAYVLVCII